MLPDFMDRDETLNLLVNRMDHASWDLLIVGGSPAARRTAAEAVARGLAVALVMPEGAGDIDLGGDSAVAGHLPLRRVTFDRKGRASGAVLVDEASMREVTVWAEIVVVDEA